MRLFAAAILAASMAAAAPLESSFPQWSYPLCPRPATAQADDVQPLSVPGSSAHFTEAEIRRFATPDWFPLEHAEMPGIVAASHSPKKIACSFCHLPDGSGRPENAKIAGLPAAYIIAQVTAFQSIERHAALPNWPPSKLMAESVADLREEEIVAAAEYFSHQAVHSFVTVTEREFVPRYAASCFVYKAVEQGSARLGAAVIEMPKDLAGFERRDPHTTYLAYVPKGSIARGRELATTGGAGRTLACAACHGATLRGGIALPGPPLAGRFPGYLFRQLYGFQSGARGGISAQPMRSVVAKLTERDMIDLAAYAASLKP
jgi:cytochrome c553